MGVNGHRYEGSSLSFSRDIWLVSIVRDALYFKWNEGCYKNASGSIFERRQRAEFPSSPHGPCLQAS